MASTLLNEDLVIAMLGNAPSADHGEDLRTAALLVLLDAYDRKVDRPSFFDMAKTALQMNEMMGRLESITGVHTSFKNNLITGEKLTEAIGVITGHAEFCRKALIKDMALLMQCPEDADTKH